MVEETEAREDWPEMLSVDPCRFAAVRLEVDALPSEVCPVTESVPEKVALVPETLVMVRFVPVAFVKTRFPIVPLGDRSAVDET